ncbi:MAG TPA: rhodanese-like domain-containing protein [Saccharofermentans sp.]|jgi:phage shock protein E|nr:rhodanese-like domain-containing protein [Clostridia bacterium]NLX68817.1 rhodanese-like domain-containing protein [Clostridiaceae bacterium]HOO48251.1 rhodanese-like domain-containing protein [Saccharofermentans sp.]HPE27882.1 rhodanese-like domain-containing protein [Saccharofermentans sp.]HPG64329.1 rhodanese-like domain-containing protein [Saccharofermentans sp.]
MNRKKFIIPLMLVFVFAFVSCSSFVNLDQTDGKELGYLQIDAEQAKTLMDTETDYIILDVRTEEEYNEGHIPNAILIPNTEIRERAELELTDQDQLILVYCRSGNRSKLAAAILVELGYTNVVEFGGINSWPYDIES